MSSTYATPGIQSFLLQFLTTGLNRLCDVLLRHSVRVQTLHYCKVLQRVPLQHALLYVLSVNRNLSLSNI